MEKIKIEIWSDIMCPFCYIGKRRFEKALEQFEHKDKVLVKWHSFILQPGLFYDPEKSIIDFLVKSKGMSSDQAEQTIKHVTCMAKGEGLEYQMEKICLANSFDAHRLTHFAATQGLQNEAEERLFKAYFTEGRNIESHEILTLLGSEIGLDEEDVKNMLESNQFSNEVNNDVKEARTLGINGVPFFVISRKYGISGAQPSESFLRVLNEVALS